ncbi:MAG: ribonuclease HII [Gammaproteobacteria bacterium]
MNALAGVDEAGRGPLAGPVVAAAVILPVDNALSEIDDSKKLTHRQRIRIADQVIRNADSFCVASATAREIDALNILNATFLAMQRAVAGLTVRPASVRVDGNRCPSFEWKGVTLEAQALVGGDGLDRSIGAASILAKVWRDQHMLNLNALFPQYGFAKHKGYPTAAHRQALEAHGPCSEHRVSFRPVANALAVRGPGAERS